MTKSQKSPKMKPKPTRLNRAQKEGIARVFDGFAIFCGIAVYSYLGGMNDMTAGNAFVTFCTGIICEGFAILLRKE